jgi:GTP cyclohydrolase I
MTTVAINHQNYNLLTQKPSANGHSNGHNGDSNGHVNGASLAVFTLPVAGAEATAQTSMEGAVRHILEAIGEDPDRQGLQRTPTRVAKAYAELTAGYHIDPEALINDAVFDVSYDEMVLVKDIDFFSLCEHHMLPFYGKAHVAYIPKGKVIGLSKIPRIVEMFARRLQVQERMTQEIADFLHETLDAQGVAVVVEGQHMCAAMRGVKKANARMTTSAMLGSFKHNPQTRAEFLDHVGRHAHR